MSDLFWLSDAQMADLRAENFAATISADAVPQGGG